jgi:hypothetical protein
MISRHAILLPLFAYVLLTVIVTIVMYRRRVAEMVGLLAYDLVIEGKG